MKEHHSREENRRLGAQRVSPAAHGVGLAPVALEGIVERIVFESEESGFFVGRMRVAGQADLVTFVGNLMAVSVGESIRLRGQWVEDKRFGKQLRVESFETVLPSSVLGIEKYLGSGLIEGIGPEFAKRLVAAFGVETLRIIDEAPEQLRQVPGIGKKRAGQIQEAWASQKAIQSIMIFLQGHGVSASQAVKIYKRYGDAAVAILRKNPYRLAQDISGIAFKGADKIARELGIAQDAPARLQAGLFHALGESASEGHVFLSRDELIARAAELLSAGEEQIAKELGVLRAEKLIVAEGERVFQRSLWQAEEECAQRLRLLMGSPLEALPIKIDKALQWVEQVQKIALAKEQQEAIRKGIEEKILVITGGPGTGKTTVLNSLLAILEKKGLSFLLAAPTGRAAKRMESACEKQASTLHRLLEYSPKKGAFLHDENNPLNTDLLVVDEASMLDVYLMAAVLKAVPPFARLILVGDVDQLPSVGPGNVLLDLIASGSIPVVRLQLVFRQAQESGIVLNAHLVNRGAYPSFNKTDFVFLDRPDPEQALETIVELVARRLPGRFKLDPKRDIQVLSPMRRGAAGVTRINEALQEVLNPDGRVIPRKGLRLGDKVIQLRNNYELEVFNGDVGIITLFSEEAKEVEVAFEESGSKVARKVIYSLEDLDELSLAYALTVHKAQGSEYAAVVLPFLPQHYMMLQRNVLYTAITRGKEIVVVVGEAKAVGMAVRNSKTAHRNTSLPERIRKEVWF